jgi:CheY-like chemotaxis protein
MYISKQLIELMQGSVSIQSTKHFGTTISFKLPFAIAQKPDTKNEELKTLINPNKLNQRKILIVDDNEMNRLVAEMIVQQNGAKTLHAENGQQAIEKLQDDIPDIILMDLQMPVMNGYEATHYIRYILKNPIPIIALTANAIKGERENCLEAGMNDYISKPFKEQDLIQSILSLISLNENEEARILELNGENKKDQLPYDLSILLQISRNDHQFVNKMIQLFCDDLPFQIEEIKDAIAQENTQIIAAKAHRLKPSTTNLGMPAITQKLRQIESLAKHEKFSNHFVTLTNSFIEDLEKNRLLLLDYLSKNSKV